MEKCLTKTDIDALISGKADASAMLEAMQHMEGCNRCRAAVLSAKKCREGIPELAEEMRELAGCLDYATLSACMKGTLPAEDRSDVEQHLSRCESCSECLESLQNAEARAQMRGLKVFAPAARARWWEPWLRPAMGLGLAAGAAAMLCWVFITPQAPSGSGGRIASAPSRIERTVTPKPERTQVAQAPGHEIPSAQVPARQTSPKKEMVAFCDGAYRAIGGKLVMGASGKAISLPKNLMAAVSRTLKGARPAEPVRMACANIDVLRGAEDAADLSPSALRPYGTSVMSNRPTLSWKGPERVDGYVVQVFSAKGEKLMEVAASSMSCALSEPLTRGETYQWRVGSKVGEETIFSKAAPFRVLSEPQYREISRVRRDYGDSHFVKAVSFESYGLHEEALVEFRALAKENPSSELANQMVTNVEHELEEVRK